MAIGRYDPMARPFSHWDPGFGGIWVSGLEAAAGALFVLVWLSRRMLGALRGVQPSEVAGAAALSRRLTVIR